MKVFTISHDGNHCTCASIAECMDVLLEDYEVDNEEIEPGFEFTIKCEEMTKEQYNALGEFQGW